MAEFIKFQFFCPIISRVTSGTIQDGIDRSRDMGLIWDGTKCGDNRVKFADSKILAVSKMTSLTKMTQISSLDLR